MLIDNSIIMKPNTYWLSPLKTPKIFFDFDLSEYPFFDLIIVSIINAPDILLELEVFLYENKLYMLQNNDFWTS